MWIYGTHAVRAALANQNRQVNRLCLTRGALEQMESWVDAKRHPKWEIVEGKTLSKWVGEDIVHQGVAIDVTALPTAPLASVLEAAKDDQRPVVILDQVTDPHNVGAILRSAAAFNAAAVIVQDRHSPAQTGVMAKAASGGLDIVPIAVVTNISQSLDQLKQAGYWVAGLAGEADVTLAEAKLNPRTALVLGAEGKGLRPLVAKHCDVLVRLPIASQMESLNVSNAAAIALYALHISP